MKRATLLMTFVVLAAAAVAIWYDATHGLTAVGRRIAATVAAYATAAPAPGTLSRRAQAGRVIAVTTARAKQADFPIRRRSIGVIESPASVTVKSRIDSVILTQHVHDGQMVRKGDLLFTLDDKEIRAVMARDEATLAKDRAGQAKTAADLNRMQQLLEKNAAARAQVETAAAEAKAAEATVAADQAVLTADRLKLSYTTIEAPIEGRIGAVRVTPGNLVGANDISGAGLLTITQVKPVRVSFTLPERDLGLLRQARGRKRPGEVRAYRPSTTQPLAEGALDFIDSAVDTASGTITAKATFANADLTLWPGQYVDVEIDLDVKPDVTIVPTIAVQAGQNGSFVFVVKPDKTVAIRPVALIGAEGTETALESGLEPGEPVVVEGQLRLIPGARVEATPRPPGEPPRAAATARNEDRR